MSKLSTEYGLLASAIDPKLSTEYAVSTPIQPAFLNRYMISGVSNTSRVYPAYNTVNSNGKGLFCNSTSSDFGTNQKTISFWVYADSSFTNNHTLGVDYVGTNNSYGVMISGTSLIFWNLGSARIQRFNTWLNNNDGDGSVLDQWIHVIITTGTTPTTGSIYVNNVSRTIGTYTTGINAWESVAINYSGQLAAMRYAGNNYLSMETSVAVKFDEFAVWDGVLSQSERDALYNNGVPHNLTNLDTSGSGATLIRYLRYGDGANDSESDIYCQVDPTFRFSKNSLRSGETFITSLAPTDDPYA
jgi:hypothetical protein